MLNFIYTRDLPSLLAAHEVISLSKWIMQTQLLSGYYETERLLESGRVILCSPAMTKLASGSVNQISVSKLLRDKKNLRILKIFRACDCVLGTKQLGVQKTKTQTAIVIKLRLR